MSKITFENKVSVVDSALPEINKITDDNLNEIKTSVNALYDYNLGLGWERYFDSTHTELSPQTLTAGQNNLITIDGATSILDQSPVGVGPLFASNKINGVGLNDILMFRLDFKGKIANADGSFEAFIDIGGEIGLVWITAQRFRRGANTEEPFAFSSFVYTGSTFIANGGQIFIKPSHTMEVYSKSILIHRTYIGR